MIVGRRFLNGRADQEPVDVARVRELLGEPETFLWLDAEEPTEADLATIQKTFGVHPLTVEDAQHRDERPKVELYRDYAFVVLRPLGLAEEELVEQELHALVGPDYLVTLRFAPAFEMSEVVRRWERSPELLCEGGGFALYVLIDEVVDDYLSAVERFEDTADDLEDEVFAEESPDDGSEVQQRLFRLKREIVRLRRFAMPLRQGLDLIQERPQLATGPLGPYYRDATDHVIRVVELADNIRDLLTSLLEVRIAQVANRLNEVMKRLTSWAAIILVPTLIAGIYGMNFRNMPELSWSLGYPLAIGMMVASGLLLFRMFRTRGWL